MGSALTASSACVQTAATSGSASSQASAARITASSPTPRSAASVRVAVAPRPAPTVKLFVGGLKQHTTGAMLQRALSQYGVCSWAGAKVDRIAARLILPYDLHGSCRQVLARWEVAVEAEDFADQVRLSVSLAAEDLQQLQRELADATSGRVCLELDEWTEDTRDEGDR